MTAISKHTDGKMYEVYGRDGVVVGEVNPVNMLSTPLSKKAKSFSIPYKKENSIGCYFMQFKRNDIVDNTERIDKFSISFKDMLNDINSVSDDYSAFTKLDEKLELLQNNDNYIISSIVCYSSGDTFNFHCVLGVSKKISEQTFSRIRIIPFNDEESQSNILKNVKASKFNVLYVSNNINLNFIVVEEIDYEEMKMVKEAEKMAKTKTINIPKEKWTSDHRFGSDILGRYDVPKKIVVRNV